MKKKQTVKELRAELAEWKEIAERRADLLSAAYAELEAEKQNYALLNSIVAKVLKSEGAEKRRA